MNTNSKEQAVSDQTSPIFNLTWKQLHVLIDNWCNAVHSCASKNRGMSLMTYPDTADSVMYLTDTISIVFFFSKIRAKLSITRNKLALDFFFKMLYCVTSQVQLRRHRTKQLSPDIGQGERHRSDENADIDGLPERQEFGQGDEWWQWLSRLYIEARSSFAERWLSPSVFIMQNRYWLIYIAWVLAQSWFLYSFILCRFDKLQPFCQNIYTFLIFTCSFLYIWMQCTAVIRVHWIASWYINYWLFLGRIAIDIKRDFFIIHRIHLCQSIKILSVYWIIRMLKLIRMYTILMNAMFKHYVQMIWYKYL